MEPGIYEQIKRSVKTFLHIDLNHYKEKQMHRRLDSWLVRSGAPDWNVYIKRLDAEHQERARFRDYLTINVSSFFRDKKHWAILRKTILPDLMKSGTPGLRVEGGRSRGLRTWSAGCSIGAEPYSLAMILTELAPARHHYLLATDLDRGILSKARARGPYTADDVKNLSPRQRIAYLQAGGPPFFVKETLAKQITFREHDLLANPFERNFDLIICRNVVIYFTLETKTRLYQKFHTALRPGGVLFLGGTEIIPRPHEFGFRSHGTSFYQRLR